MAAGAILIPDGNDSLLVVGLPSSDPNAVLGYSAMFVLLFIPMYRWSALRNLAKRGMVQTTR